MLKILPVILFLLLWRPFHPECGEYHQRLLHRKFHRAGDAILLKSDRKSNGKAGRTYHRGYVTHGNHRKHVVLSRSVRAEIIHSSLRSQRCFNVSGEPLLSPAIASGEPSGSCDVEKPSILRREVLIASSFPSTSSHHFLPTALSVAPRDTPAAPSFIFLWNEDPPLALSILILRHRAYN